MYQYLYTIIICVLIIALAFVLRQVLIIGKNIKTLNPKFISINDKLDQIKQKKETLIEMKNSWYFFIGIIAIFQVIKETLKNKKKEPTTVAFSKACIKHSSQIKKLKV